MACNLVAPPKRRERPRPPQEQHSSVYKQLASNTKNAHTIATIGGSFSLLSGMDVLNQLLLTASWFETPPWSPTWDVGPLLLALGHSRAHTRGWGGSTCRCPRRIQRPGSHQTTLSPCLKTSNSHRKLKRRTSSNKGIATNGAPGRTTRSNRTLLGAPGRTTRSNRTLLGAPGIATRSKGRFNVSEFFWKPVGSVGSGFCDVSFN